MSIDTQTASAASGQLVKNLVDAHGYEEAVSILARLSGYSETPPKINEFLDDDYYLGRVLGNSTYPIWRNALYQIYPNQFKSPFVEIVLTGGIGLGKSTCALAGTMYDICKLQHLEKPQEHYKLLRSTSIMFALINATMTLAGDVLLAQVEEWVNESPYFKTLQQGKITKPVFKKNVGFITGSRFSHVLGRAIFGAILSELNFQKKVNNQAIENYTNIKRRMQSRFMQEGGDLPGHVWLDSSKSDGASFIENYAERTRGDPSVVIYEYPLWKANEHKGIYSGQTFKVFSGDKVRDPFIIEKSVQVVGLDEARIIDVPVEFRKDFNYDIHKSLRDIAGVGTWSTMKYIPSAERVTEALIRPNPMTREVIELKFNDKTQKLVNFIEPRYFKTLDRRPRFIHIDLGVKYDRTGIACTRLDGMVELTKIDPLTGQKIRIREPIFYTEWVMAIVATPGEEVPIFKVRDLMIDLKVRQVPLAIVSTDGYQSTQLRQELLANNGIQAELYSVDRTRDPYDIFKTAILEGRYNCVRHPILQNELLNLMDLGDKIDHDTDGSKDIADACAGSVYSCFINMHKQGASFDSQKMGDAIDREIMGRHNSIYDQLLNTGSVNIIGHGHGEQS